MLYLDRTMLLNALHFRAKKKINKSFHRYYKTNIKTTYRHNGFCFYESC